MKNERDDFVKDPLFYKIVRPLLAIFIKLFRPIVINKNNIPSTGKVILAGNHTSYLDPLIVGYSTKRCVHFFAKDSLYKGIKKIIFKGLGIIPVNRKFKDKSSLIMGKRVLEADLLVGIFPEGTINKTNDVIMPFKFGTVKMAQETNAVIVPFAITGKYRFLKQGVKIVFGKAYNINSNDLEQENNILMDKVVELVRSEKNANYQ